MDGLTGSGQSSRQSVDVAEPGEAEAAFKPEDMLMMSPEEQAAYEAAVAAYEAYEREAGSCGGGDGDASAGQ